MEMFDLYDIDRILTGETVPRGSVLPENRYRIVVHICIFSSDGRMLIQQRQPFKHGWSGMWDLSVGGSVISGENSVQGIIREVREEIGLDLSDSENMRPAVTLNSDDVFDDIFLLSRDVDINTLRLQPEEVKAVKWAGETEIYDMIDKGEFIPYNKCLIALFFSQRNKGGRGFIEGK